MQECKLDLINQLLGAFEFTEKPASKQLATWSPEIPVILLPEALGPKPREFGISCHSCSTLGDRMPRRFFSKLIALYRIGIESIDFKFASC
jgi:hypothetical protein